MAATTSVSRPTPRASCSGSGAAIAHELQRYVEPRVIQPWISACASHDETGMMERSSRTVPSSCGATESVRSRSATGTAASGVVPTIASGAPLANPSAHAHAVESPSASLCAIAAQNPSCVGVTVHVFSTTSPAAARACQGPPSTATQSGVRKTIVMSRSRFARTRTVTSMGSPTAPLPETVEPSNSHGGVGCEATTVGISASRSGNASARMLTSGGGSDFEPCGNAGPIRREARTGLRREVAALMRQLDHREDMKEGMRVVSGPPLDVPPGTVATMFLDSAKRYADQTAFEWREGETLQRLSYREVESRVRETAAGLVALGLKPGDNVALLAETRHEWGIADLAIQLAGGVTVTIFTTLAPDQIAFQLRDAGARVAFVDNAAQLAKLRQVASELNAIETFVAFDAQASSDDEVGKRTVSLADLPARGRPFAGELDVRLRSRKPEDASTIIYTSGTTGIPKGAVLTHRNCLSAARMPTLAFGLDEYDDRATMVFLPLAHSLTRAVFLNAIDLGARIGFGSPRHLVDDLRAMPPRLLASAPRIYERIHDQYLNTAQQANPVRRRIMLAARDTAIEFGAALADGGSASIGLRIRHAGFDRLVYSKLREKLGLTELQLALSGAAAIRPELLHFFRGVGILIVEAWGLTETSAPGCTNPHQRVRPGTVGKPFPGVDIALADDGETAASGASEDQAASHLPPGCGEILVAGPNVFQGYHRRPEESAAAFVEIDGKRWFRTGDIGRFDEAGYLQIVDRKKELEILDTGKKIAPVLVEETLKTVSPFVAEACLVGTGRKFAGALIQANFDRLVAWAKENGVAFDQGMIVVRPDPTGAPMTYTVGQDLLSDPKVQALFQDAVDKCNARVAEFERIRVFRLVPNVFSMERDELTVKLSKKRRVILEHYRDEVDAMFR